MSSNATQVHAARVGFVSEHFFAVLAIDYAQTRQKAIPFVCFLDFDFIYRFLDAALERRLKDLCLNK
jgi:hypothetical protein